jgi:aminoglycoside phosphotransferase (APT) family kinase protein
MERLGGGRTAEVFAVDREEVVKVLRPGMPEVIGEREAAVAVRVDAAGIAAPRFLGVTRVHGRFAIRYERVSGPSMLDRIAARPIEIDRLAVRFAELHAAMHRSDGTGLPDQRDALRRMMDRAGDALAPEARAAATRRLDSLVTGSAICHGDMHPGNVILSARGPVVIDWMTATCGSPTADIARTIYLVRDTPIPGYLPRVQRAMVRLARRRFVSTYRRRYLALRPTDPVELDAWRLPVLAARFGEGIEEERLPLTASLEAELGR